MRPDPTRVLLLLLLFYPFVAAKTNFTQCLIDFRNETGALGGVDYRGNPTSSAQAVGFTYETCTTRCGPQSEAFNWREFTQLFASWLLPWLALISQLPFGSGDYADDFVSVIMSVGSPALAAYSLILTSLNARLVYRRAKKCTHESAGDVANALISLQQIPLKLTDEPRLLKYIPINHHWREEIADRLNRRNAWSVAAAASIFWVVIAYLFTLVDSFVSLASDTGNEPSEGQAVGTLWLWLLCLVVGWLWVPTFTSGELRRALVHANRQAVKKAAKKIKQKANKAITTAKNKVNKVNSKFAKRKDPKAPGIETPREESQKAKEESIQEDVNPKTPFPEPLSEQPTVSYQEYHEGQRDHSHIGIGANLSDESLHRSVAQSSIKLGKHTLFVPVDLDSLNRDERRIAATFNYSRVMRYLVFVDDVLNALEDLASDREEVGLSRNRLIFWISMFNASIVSLVLQSGITAAATGIVIFTPTIGLGCRSLGYLIYGGLSITIMILTIISTIFARIAETRGARSSVVRFFTAFIAIALRRICLLLALVNMIGLILISCLQFSNFLNNCYCNASVLGRGAGSYIVISYDGWFDTMREARITATVVAAISMSIYMVFLRLMSTLPRSPADM
ncbi:hypothetical protein BJ322DRAFT_1007586 [Thelephora terrestris]|uniref:TRP C-terminal domain-containing protein n=1 Tax=Thelephora terrestris TaxID=56493 RepID=A0A9P6L607_9AGAM|nr:hypothetical protein BJ322DRAFT_1007586 [Thelephora terrestris]